MRTTQQTSNEHSLREHSVCAMNQHARVRSTGQAAAAHLLWINCSQQLQRALLEALLQIHSDSKVLTQVATTGLYTHHLCYFDARGCIHVQGNQWRIANLAAAACAQHLPYDKHSHLCYFDTL
jgi:hypothetical protein